MTPEARALVGVFQSLSERDRATLADFARFLAERSERPALAPIFTLRPAGESVMHAVKRLNRSYPMLDRRRLLQPVGALVSAHMLDGRGAAETVEALEELFAECFREYAADTRGAR